MTYCHLDEFEDAVLSVELAAKKFQSVQTNPTSWKWVIIAMQNAGAGFDGARSRRDGWLRRSFSQVTEAKPRVAAKSNA
jgi:hypothetical protein